MFQGEVRHVFAWLPLALARPLEVPGCRAKCMFFIAVEVEFLSSFVCNIHQNNLIVIICYYMLLYVIICYYMLLYVIIWYYMVLHVIICYYMLLYGIIWYYMLFYVIICYYYISVCMCFFTFAHICHVSVSALLDASRTGGFATTPPVAAWTGQSWNFKCKASQASGMGT